MQVPPDGAVALTRTRSPGAARAVRVAPALCPVVPALPGAAVRSGFRPLLRLDATAWTLGTVLLFGASPGDRADRR